MSVQLGPNHPARHDPIGPKPWKPKRTATPVPSPQTRYSLPQLLRAYEREHAGRYPVECPCLLCADYRAHVAAHKARQNGGGR